jgi:hypothetical protein
VSDVATKAGLPPPLFGLLQFVQRGRIGDHSVADIARAMYRSGYDFRHFLAGGASVAIIEVFVRTAWTVRELSEGKKLTEALPVASPRLRSGLFLSHSVATAVNAGKVAIVKYVVDTTSTIGSNVADRPANGGGAHERAFFIYDAIRKSLLLELAPFLSKFFVARIRNLLLTFV